MRLAISNIAWPTEQEPAVADRLAGFGVDGVEIAPTKVWAHPLEASEAEVRAYRDFWERRGLPIVALQALLFEKPQLRLFAGPEQRAQMEEYLAGIIRLAGWLGAEVLVFGSPRNRSRGACSLVAAHETAVPFFRQIGRIAQAHGTIFCVEPNPPAYGCDFITGAAEGLELVKRVDHPGFGLHLDAAGMVLNGDDPAGVFREALPGWHHFHVSEPFLGPVGQGRMDHRSLATELRASGYGRWISIEMKVPAAGFDLASVEHAIAFVRSAYATSGVDRPEVPLGPACPFRRESA